MEHSEEALRLFAEAIGYFDEMQHFQDRYNDLAGDLYRMGYRLPQMMADYPCLRIEQCDSFSRREHLIEFFAVGRVAAVIEISKKRADKRVSHNEVIAALGKHFHWICIYCQRAGDESKGPDGRVWHVDHGYPRILGGDDDPENLILACATCNLSKNKKTVMEALRRTLAKMEAGGK